MLITGCTVITEDVAKERASEFINTVLIAPGSTAEIKEIIAENGVFKLVVTTQGQEITSYMSGDGKLFFPTVLDIDELMQKATEVTQAPEVSQAEKPSVELFVMSHCPYGTQMEKGILPVVDQLGDAIDFQLKFVNYAMHGEKEVKEQLNQYCVNRDQNEKLLPYLECFLGSDGGDTAGETCLAEVGVDTEQLTTCAEETDAEFSIIANLEDQGSWLNGRFPKFMIHDAENKAYGVQGSPALVINGAKVQAGRDSAGLLNLICSSFTEMPEACEGELPAQAPAPGFGWEGAGVNTDASCG